MGTISGFSAFSWTVFTYFKVICHHLEQLDYFSVETFSLYRLAQANSCASSMVTYFQEKNKPSKLRNDRLSLLPCLSKSKSQANPGLKRKEIGFPFQGNICKDTLGRAWVWGFCSLWPSEILESNLQR